MSGGTGTPSHLVLVGLPGSGKTTAGEGAAARLGWDFFDFDRLIEERTGRSVAELFAAEGEPRFRALEGEVTRQVAASARPYVAAPGGGWVLDREGVALLGRGGRLVYLRLSPAAALSRLGTAAGGRPLLMGPDPLARLEGLLRDRRAHYEAADSVIDVEHLAPQQVIDTLAELATLATP